MEAISTVLHRLVGSRSLQKFGVGEKVRVDSDESKAMSLQEDHGGWNSGMKKVLYLPLFVAVYSL